MSEFSLTTVFVVPVGNTLPTTGGTEAQTAGQFGVRKDEARTIATNGNIATAAFIQFFQGREASIGAVLGTKRSDRIKSTKVKEWYKIVGNGTATNQVTTVGEFTASCDEALTLTVEVHSSLADAVSYNGFKRSITIQTPCCDCGSDPCVDVDNEAIVDLFIAQIAAYNSQAGNEALHLGRFLTFAKTGTGDTAVITITGKAIPTYSNIYNTAAYPHEYDRVWFRTFVSKATDNFVDFEAADLCDSAATVTVTTRATIPYLTAPEVAWIEKDYYSYQSGYKHLFADPGYNQAFESFVTAGTVYDEYVIQFDEYKQNDAWFHNQQEDERVRIFFPTGAGSVVETMLTTYLGAPAVKTAGTISVSPVTP